MFPLFGAIYYGCCDRLDDRLNVIEKLPQVRKISCSPWSDRERFAANLDRKRYVMSNKPSPAFLATPSLEEDAIRADLRRTIRAARELYDGFSGAIQSQVANRDVLVRDEEQYAALRIQHVDELIDALEVGALEEAWGCGTAAVISPIGKLAYKDKTYIVNGGEIGEVTHMLYDTLTGIQWGKIEDPFGWTLRI